MVSFASPYPLQPCLSEALLRIWSVLKSFELGSFPLLAWCLWNPSAFHMQLGWSAPFPAVAPRGSRTEAVQGHLAHISQMCGRWIQDSVSLWRAVPTAVGWMFVFKAHRMWISKETMSETGGPQWSGVQLGMAGWEWSCALILGRVPSSRPLPLGLKIIPQLVLPMFFPTSDILLVQKHLKWEL